MGSNFLFGWGLIFNSVSSELKKKEDLAIVFIHWNLIKRNFGCIGIGDEKTLKGDEIGSESLPNGWNANDHYTLRYIDNNKLYILHGIPTDGNLIVNFLRGEDLDVSTISINIEEQIKEISSGAIDKMIPEYNELSHRIKVDLIDAVCKKVSSTSSTQTQSEKSRPRVQDPRDPLLERCIPGAGCFGGGLPGNPYSVGRSDLDPFAPGGGGMIFDPFSPNRNPIDPGIGIPGGIPRIGIPPGARYDPVGPPLGPNPIRPNPLGRNPNPDADHFRPPGNFPDNMFM